MISCLCLQTSPSSEIPIEYLYQWGFQSVTQAWGGLCCHFYVAKFISSLKDVPLVQKEETGNLLKLRWLELGVSRQIDRYAHTYIWKHRDSYIDTHESAWKRNVLQVAFLGEETLTRRVVYKTLTCMRGVNLYGREGTAAGLGKWSSWFAKLWCWGDPSESSQLEPGPCPLTLCWSASDRSVLKGRAVC